MVTGTSFSRNMRKLTFMVFAPLRHTYNLVIIQNINKEKIKGISSKYSKSSEFEFWIWMPKQGVHAWYCVHGGLKTKTTMVMKWASTIAMIAYVERAQSE